MRADKKVDKIMHNNLLIYHDLIAGIVEAMDARDPYTASHSERVSNITEQICSFFELAKEKKETIHIAAHVHDIGKIGIPDYVLTKSSGLTEAEFEIMRSHSEIGFNILKKIKGFNEIAKIVRHHHERWNGKGYPHGLKEMEIPFGSRIISVADSIDAMLNDRIYREAMTVERCRIELEKNKGIMYDPEIVTIVLNHWDIVLDIFSNQENQVVNM